MIEDKRTYADDRVCPVCGKEFICYRNDQWVYKCFYNGEKILCSWTCLRKLEAEKAKTAKHKGRKKKNEGIISKTEE